MSRIRTPDNIEIAAMKKKAEGFFDVMAAGSGTPWEDRGTNGVVGAFFKTITQSITGVGKLTDSIRRPETTGDATGFLIGICVIWAISAIEHAMIHKHFVAANPLAYVDSQSYSIATGIGAIAAGAGCFLLFKLYNSIYGKLIAQEKTGYSASVPAVVLHNVNAYALGPSIFAIIPYAGPPLAILLIFINLITVGKKRLNLRLTAAIIDAVIALLAVLALGFAVYWVGSLILSNAIEPVTYMEKKTPTAQ